MTEEYLMEDVPWDDEEALVDREPEQGDSRHHFGSLRLYSLRVTKSWEAGNFLTVPGVTGGQFNEKDEDGLMKFKGWKPGGNQFLFVLVAIKQDKDGQDYQIVKQYPSKRTRKDDPHLWGDFVYPALLELSDKQRKTLVTRGLFAEWEDIPTGHKVEIEGEEREIKAWGNFKIYSSHKDLREAEKAFFDQFQNSTASPDGIAYPADWVKSNSVEAMLEYAPSIEFEDHADLADKLGLIDDNGKTVQAIDGTDVNVVQIISKVLDIPEPMVKL